jgi:hypothetical protein
MVGSFMGMAPVLRFGSGRGSIPTTAGVVNPNREPGINREPEEAPAEGVSVEDRAAEREEIFNES